MVMIRHAAGLPKGDHQFYRENKRVSMSLPQYEGGHRDVKPISLLQNTPTQEERREKKKEEEMLLP